MSQIYAIHFHIKYSFGNNAFVSLIFVGSVQRMSTIKGSSLPEFRAEMIIKSMNRFVSFILRFDRCFLLKNVPFIVFLMSIEMILCHVLYLEKNIQDEIIFVLEFRIV